MKVKKSKKPLDAPLALVTAVAAIASPVVGVLVTTGLLIDAFGEVAHAPPSERSQILSDGIGHAMTFGVGVGVLIGVIAMGLLLASLAWKASHRKQG